MLALQVIMFVAGALLIPWVNGMNDFRAQQKEKHAVIDEREMVAKQARTEIALKLDSIGVQLQTIQLWLAKHDAGSSKTN